MDASKAKKEASEKVVKKELGDVQHGFPRQIYSGTDYTITATGVKRCFRISSCCLRVIASKNSTNRIDFTCDCPAGCLHSC
jgi:hypothetical protein